MQRGIFDLLLATGEGRVDGTSYGKEGRQASDNFFNLRRGLSWNIHCRSTVEKRLGEGKSRGRGPRSQPRRPGCPLPSSPTLNLSLTSLCLRLPACSLDARPGQAAAQCVRTDALCSGPNPGRPGWFAEVW